MSDWTFVSRDPEETRAIGRELGRAIGADGLAIALIGPLGAGKTVFVKGLAEGLGVNPSGVSSPTFVIAQQYALPEGPEVLHHIDLYRLESEEELEGIGFYDMLAPGSVLAVEWADRFPGVLGRESLIIEFEGPSAAEADGDGDAGRTSRVTAEGEVATLISKDWSQRVEQRLVTEGGTGSFLEMRVTWMLLLACGLLLGAMAERLPSDLVLPGMDGAACVQFVGTATDALGTREVRCGDTAEGSALEGVGRLVAGERIELNRASEALLTTLPGIGPARAAAIVDARAAKPFQSARDLERVRGIGPVMRDRLTQFVWVDSRRDWGRDLDRDLDRDRDQASVHERSGSSRKDG